MSSKKKKEKRKDKQNKAPRHSPRNQKKKGKKKNEVKRRQRPKKVSIRMGIFYLVEIKIFFLKCKKLVKK